MIEIGSETTSVLQAKLHRTAALLHLAYQVRDGLAAERFEMERAVGMAASDLLVALDHAEHTLLAVEAEMHAAINALLDDGTSKVRISQRRAGTI